MAQDESATADLFTFDNVPGTSGTEVSAYVSAILGDYALDELTDAFRDALNAELDGTGISLHGELFIGPYLGQDKGAAKSIVAQALSSVDVGTLAARFEKQGGELGPVTKTYIAEIEVLFAMRYVVSVKEFDPTTRLRGTEYPLVGDVFRCQDDGQFTLADRALRDHGWVRADACWWESDDATDTWVVKVIRK